jgi:hypothetical protein
MIWWIGLAPWEFEFTFPGSLISISVGLEQPHMHLILIKTLEHNINYYTIALTSRVKIVMYSASDFPGEHTTRSTEFWLESTAGVSLEEQPELHPDFGLINNRNFTRIHDRGTFASKPDVRCEQESSLAWEVSAVCTGVLCSQETASP